MNPALIDGASQWQMFRHITWPLVLPFIMVAIVIRTIDALKAFDTIFVITQGGPGTASETLNIFLYLQAFQFYNIGYASAVVVSSSSSSSCCRCSALCASRRSGSD